MRDRKNKLSVRTENRLLDVLLENFDGFKIEGSKDLRYEKMMDYIERLLNMKLGTGMSMSNIYNFALMAGRNSDPSMHEEEVRKAWVNVMGRRHKEKKEREEKKR